MSIYSCKGNIKIPCRNASINPLILETSVNLTPIFRVQIINFKLFSKIVKTVKTKEIFANQHNKLHKMLSKICKMIRKMQIVNP